MKNIKTQNIKQLIDINKRKIVIHHTHLIKDIMSLLKDNDIVFFDDCLYSQYLFIKKNLEKIVKLNIICILGFSTNLYRTNQIPIIENSAILHDNVHNNDYSALGGFMTLDELKELLQYDNILLAGHGANHLELSKLYPDNKLLQSQVFIKDINLMVINLEKINLKTNIFVFPYAYDDFPCSKKILEKYNFKYIFAAKDTKRIEIETLNANC